MDKRGTYDRNSLLHRFALVHALGNDFLVGLSSSSQRIKLQCILHEVLEGHISSVSIEFRGD